MRYFCHRCQAEVEGRINFENEPQCSACGSVFVEAVGQNIEQFLSLPSAVLSSPIIASTNTTSSFQTPHLFMATQQVPVGQTVQIVQNRGALHAGVNNGHQDLISMLLRSTGFLNTTTPDTGGGLDDILHQLFMNAQGTVATPTSPEVLAALPREREADSLRQLGECGITLEPFEPGDVALLMPCRHAFKEEAIVQWLQTHDTCPGERGSSHHHCHSHCHFHFLRSSD